MAVPHSSEFRNMWTRTDTVFRMALEANRAVQRNIMSQIHPQTAAARIFDFQTVRLSLGRRAGLSHAALTYGAVDLKGDFLLVTKTHTDVLPNRCAALGVSSCLVEANMSRDLLAPLERRLKEMKAAPAMIILDGVWSWGFDGVNHVGLKKVFDLLDELPPSPQGFVLVIFD